jgi:hypothetical protein
MIGSFWIDVFGQKFLGYLEMVSFRETNFLKRLWSGLYMILMEDLDELLVELGVTDGRIVYPHDYILLRLVIVIIAIRS